MNQGICSQVFSINGNPPICECTPTVTCAYCVQANLILWERQENAKNLPATAKIEEIGVRKTARLMGVDHHTIQRWVKNSKIPPKYVEKFNRMTG